LLAAHASFANPQIMAKKSKLFTAGEQAKKRTRKAAEIPRHKKQQLFKTINISANTAADHVTHSAATERSYRCYRYCKACCFHLRCQHGLNLVVVPVKDKTCTDEIC
jgi:hypothetical protein